MFVASEEIVSPPTCRFQNDAEVATFQSVDDTVPVVVNGVQLQLQKASGRFAELCYRGRLLQGIKIRPLDGAIAAGRNYSDTVRLWNSRFQPALRYWTAHERISPDDAAAVLQMPIDQQIEKVIEWEATKA